MANQDDYVTIKKKQFYASEIMKGNILFMQYQFASIRLGEKVVEIGLILESFRQTMISKGMDRLVQRTLIYAGPGPDSSSLYTCTKKGSTVHIPCSYKLYRM